MKMVFHFSFCLFCVVFTNVYPQRVQKRVEVKKNAKESKNLSEEHARIKEKKKEKQYKSHNFTFVQKHVIKS